jgi:CxxC motif-containing protein
MKDSLYKVKVKIVSEIDFEVIGTSMKEAKLSVTEMANSVIGDVFAAEVIETNVKVIKTNKICSY